MEYKVKNYKGEEHQVDLLNIKAAEKDGYYVVMSNGQDEHAVEMGNITKAFDEGFKPVSNEPPEEMSMLERYGRSMLDTAPMAGSMAGAVLGAPLGPAGVFGGAVIGGGVGKSIEAAGEYLLGDEIPTPTEAYGNIAQEMALGATGEGAGKLIQGAYKGAKELGKPVFRQFSRKAKPDAEAIKEAAKRLGTKPTEGMLTESKLRQGLESSISQSPFSAGREIEGQYKDIGQALRSKSEAALLPEGQVMSPMAGGAQAKEQLEKGIRTKLQPAIEVYGELAEQSPLIDVEDVKEIADNFRGKKYAKYKTGDVKTLVNNIADDMENITTLDQLRDLKTIVGAELGAAQGTKRKTLGEIGGELAELEETVINRYIGRNKGDIDYTTKSMLPKKTPIEVDDLPLTPQQLADQIPGVNPDVSVDLSETPQNVIDFKTGKSIAQTRKETDSVLQALGKRLGKDPQEYISRQKTNAPSYIRHDHAMKVLPNYVSKPSGVIGERRILEPFPKPTKELSDPLAWLDSKYGATKKLILEHKKAGMPLEVNTSSDLIAKQDYIEVMPKDTTVNMFMTTENETLNRLLFPGNPSFARQQKAIARLKEQGIKVNEISATYDDVVEKFGKKELDRKLGGAGWGPKLRDATKAGEPMSKAGKQLLNKLDFANKKYKNVSQKVKQLGQTFKLGKVRNYEDFIRKMNDLSDEVISEKLFNAKDHKNMLLFKREYPDAFKTIKTTQLSKIYEQSLTKGELSFPKLLNRVNKLGAANKRILFGKDGAKVLDDVETIYNSFPDMIGPSGTPKGEEFKNFNPGSPTAYTNELKRKLQKWLLDNPEKASALGGQIKVSDYMDAAKTAKIESRTKVAKRAKYQAAARVKKLAGEDRSPKPRSKMEKAGLHRVLLTTGDDKYSKLDMSDKQVIDLLRKASAVKGDSKMFNNIVKQLDKKVGE